MIGLIKSTLRMPSPLLVWIAFLGSVNMVAPLFFIQTLEAQITLALFCAGVGGCAGTGTSTTGDPNSISLEALDDTHPARGKVSDRFPNIALRTQFGEEVRFFDDVIQDRIVLVNFMYTTCTGI